MTGIWLASHLVLWLVVLVMAVALLAVLRNLGVIYESIEGSRRLKPAPTQLAAGQALPDVTFRTFAGEQIPLRQFQGTATAFAVVSPTCSGCSTFLQELAEGERDADPLDPTVTNKVVVSIGDQKLTAALLQRLGINGNLRVVLDPDGGTTKVWGISSTPATVITDADLRVVRQAFVGA